MEPRLYVLQVLWMTSWFHAMRQIQIQARRPRRSVLFTVTCQGVVPLNFTRGQSLLPSIALFYIA